LDADLDGRPSRADRRVLDPLAGGARRFAGEIRASLPGAQDLRPGFLELSGSRPARPHDVRAGLAQLFRTALAGLAHVLAGLAQPAAHQIAFAPHRAPARPCPPRCATPLLGCMSLPLPFRRSCPRHALRTRASDVP
jgi:hypothetical protein